MKCQILSFALAACVLLTGLTPVWARPTDDEIKADYATTKAALAPLLLDLNAPGEDNRGELQQHVWSLEAQWLTSALDELPSPTQAALRAALQRLDKDFGEGSLQAFKRNNTSYLLVVNQELAFIAQARGQHFESVWNSRGYGDDFDRGAAMGGIDYFNAGMLPDDANGMHRFYLDEHRWQGAGQIGTYFMSAWGWRDGKARLLLQKEHLRWADDPASSFDGKYLHIPSVSFWKSVEDDRYRWRRYDWRIRVRSKGIEDAGISSETPTLDLVDDLFDRILSDRSAKSLASDRAVAALKPVILNLVATHVETVAARYRKAMGGEVENPPRDWKKELVDSPFLEDLPVWPEKPERGNMLCFEVKPSDDVPDVAFLLRIRKDNGRLFVFDAKVLPQGGCIRQSSRDRGPMTR